MYELKKIGKVFTSKYVGTGPSSYEKRIYRVAVSQRLRNTAICNYSRWCGPYRQIFNCQWYNEEYLFWSISRDRVAMAVLRVRGKANRVWMSGEERNLFLLPGIDSRIV